jgi:hypothetical protein
MTPDRPGVWRARYKEGFAMDYRVFEGKDDYGRPALLCLPGASARGDLAPTVRNMTEILGTFGAWWEGEVVEEPVELPPPFNDGGASPDPR